MKRRDITIIVFIVEVEFAHAQWVATASSSDGFYHPFASQRALWTAKATESCIRDCVGSQAGRGDVHGFEEVGIVKMEHGPIVDRIRQVPRAATAGGKVDVDTQDAAVVVESDLPVRPKIVAFTRQDHVVVAVKAAFHWPSSLHGTERSQCGPLGCLGLFATEGTTHASNFDGDCVGRATEHASYGNLNLGRMLC